MRSYSKQSRKALKSLIQKNYSLRKPDASRKAEYFYNYTLYSEKEEKRGVMSTNSEEFITVLISLK